MNLVRFALERYQFTSVVIALLTILGVSSFLSMPRSEDPQFNFAAATVIAVYPGASPTDIEQLIVDPLEESIYELEDLKKVETDISDGVAVIFVEFLQGTDPDDAYADVVEASNNARRELPSELASLKVRKQSPTDVNVLQVALVSQTAEYNELRRQAEQLERRFERLPEIKRADIWGLPDEEIQVELDLERMREVGVSFNQIAGAVRGAGLNIPGGDLEIGDRRYNVKTSGDYNSLETLRRTAVKSTGGRTIWLEDVADIRFGYDDITYLARVDGSRAVFVTVVQREGTNIFDAIDGAKAVLSVFEQGAPDEVLVNVVFDQSVSVASRVGGFFANLLQGMALVGLVVLLALGFRAAFIVLLAIPMSLFMALGWLDYSGFGLQQMSIVGLVIALGLLVDNAIVVTENVERFRRQGRTGMQAALDGASQVAWPIVSATVTTILAFLPMVLLQTGTGDFIRSMPLTVIYALGASLIVSLTLTPLLIARLRGRKSENKTSEDAESGERELRFARWLRLIAEGPYRSTLGLALRRPGWVLGIALIVFAGSMALIPLVGVSLFPKAEKPQFLINIDLPEGSNLARTDAVSRTVEQKLAGVAGVASVAANIGHGNPRVYYNAFPKNETPTHAQLFVQLAESDPKAVAQIVRRVRSGLSEIPGARIEVKEFLQGPPVTAPIAISVVGEDLDVLRRESERLEAVFGSVAGTIDVDNPSRRYRTDMRVAINRDKAGLLGVPLDALDQTVRTGLAGVPVTTYRDQDGEDYPVVLTVAGSAQEDLPRFDRLVVPSRSGGSIPIRQVARLEFESSPISIEHLNLERVATVTADVSDGYNIAEVTGAILASLGDRSLPPGYRYQIGGEEESRSESFGGMGQALIIALLGIFAVLVLQFGSFRQPLIVFAAIPFAITGSVMALLISGYTFSFTAFVGLTSLVGIVVNNSIILVDYANALRKEGASLIEAIQNAGETRFTPIVLTTLTTIGGLLPLTLTGSTMWSPMGWAIIGGLAVSTLLTLVVVPSLYQLLTPSKA